MRSRAPRWPPSAAAHSRRKHVEQLAQQGAQDVHVWRVADPPSSRPPLGAQRLGLLIVYLDPHHFVGSRQVD